MYSSKPYVLDSPNVVIPHVIPPRDRKMAALAHLHGEQWPTTWADTEEVAADDPAGLCKGHYIFTTHSSPGSQAGAQLSV